MAEQAKLSTALFLIVLFGVLRLAAGLFVLTLIYGVVLIIFRYAFGVELWNPFR
jgi:hypothetical protein